MAAAKAPALAVVFGGKAKGGSMPPEADAEPEDDGEIAEDFEAYAVEAFPDMEGSPDRMMALKRAIRACVKADKAGGY